MCPTDVFFTYPQAQCTTPHRIKQFSNFLVSNCGSILHGPSGSFQSTNFPNNYLSDEYCTWKVQVPLGKKVRLEFEEFRTEENKDFVLIYDSGKTDPIIGFSGVKDKPRAITSSGNSIRVRFISNGENVNNGFKVAYKQTGEWALIGFSICEWALIGFLYEWGKVVVVGEANTSYCTCRLLFCQRTCNLYQTVLYIRLPHHPDDIRVSSVVSYSY